MNFGGKNPVGEKKRAENAKSTNQCVAQKKSHRAIKQMIWGDKNMCLQTYFAVVCGWTCISAHPKQHFYVQLCIVDWFWKLYIVAEHCQKNASHNITLVKIITHPLWSVVAFYDLKSKKYTYWEQVSEKKLFAQNGTLSTMYSWYVRQLLACQRFRAAWPSSLRLSFNKMILDLLYDSCASNLGHKEPLYTCIIGIERKQGAHNN